jgi:hypothetical protein
MRCADAVMVTPRLSLHATIPPTPSETMIGADSATSQTTTPLLVHNGPPKPSIR